MYALHVLQFRTIFTRIFHVNFNHKLCTDDVLGVVCLRNAASFSMSFIAHRTIDYHIDYPSRLRTHDPPLPTPPRQQRHKKFFKKEKGTTRVVKNSMATPSENLQSSIFKKKNLQNSILPAVVHNSPPCPPHLPFYFFMKLYMLFQNTERSDLSVKW